MDRPRDDAPERARLALLAVAAAALALLAPSLLSVAAGDAPATVGLTVVALLVAALVRLGDQGLLLVGGLLAAGPPVRRAVPPVLAGRVTDTTHHPLRPRAPATD